MRQSVNISVNWLQFFFHHHCECHKTQLIGCRRNDAPRNKEMQSKKKSLFFFYFALVCKCARIVWLTLHFHFVHSFVRSMLVSQTNWRDDNVLVPRELVFSFHAKSIVLRSLMYCLDYELFCFDCAPPHIFYSVCVCARAHTTRIIFQSRLGFGVAKWMCDSRLTDDAVLLAHINSFSRLHCSWRLNASKVYSTRAIVRACARSRFTF